MKANEQLERLEKRFLELELENPDVFRHRILNCALSEDRYSAYTIRRGVNRLLSKDDYCGNMQCDCACGKMFDKEHLLHNLYYFAYPPVYKMVQLSKDDVPDTNYHEQS
jgi:hypothetical protein